MSLMKWILSMVPVLLAVAFYTLLERKILSFSGIRMGPYKVSMLGILQPFGDALKLANKSMNMLMETSYLIYYLSTSASFVGALMCWNVCFSNPSAFSVKYFILFIMLILGLNSLMMMMIGWSTFSKYSMMGSMRTVSQLISYEPVLYISMFFPMVLMLSYNSASFLNWDINYFLILPMLVYSWLPSMLAELNRSPFDFSEGESELVSGFNTEFGSISFTLIFLAEYSMMLMFCFLTSMIFVTNMTLWLTFFMTFLIWSRASLPRLRFDKLMYFSWKSLIPILTSYFILMFIWKI